MSSKIILAIETSCDETSVAILRCEKENLAILSNQVSSQVELHAQWGGVVPNLAAREHTKNISPVLFEALSEAQISLSQIDLISVTSGPGLIPALMVGVNFAKTLSYLLEKPLLGIHHIEGHIYANYINPDNKSLSEKFHFPALALVVSGGHTQLIFMRDHFQYEIIGQTLDDAVGEAFDKVARILNIGYPGGPAVSALAEKYKPSDERRATSKFHVQFPRPMINSKNFDFSFSGLKTAVLYETKKNPDLLKDAEYISKICYEFQQAAVDVLISKTIKAAEKYQPKTIMLAGGVSANKKLREQLGQAIQKNLPSIIYNLPLLELTGDNAAMIGVAACFRWQKMTTQEKKTLLKNWKNLQAEANLKLKPID